MSTADNKNGYTSEEEKSYLWAHFVFNAEQRLKAFNFFVVLSVFADGGFFSTVGKVMPSSVLILIGCFICLLAIVFFVIDLRSQRLLRLSGPGLLEYEKKFPEHSRVFAKEKLQKAGCGTYISYSYAFRFLFLCQLLFGLGIIIYYGLLK